MCRQGEFGVTFHLAADEPAHDESALVGIGLWIEAAGGIAGPDAAPEVERLSGWETSLRVMHDFQGVDFEFLAVILQRTGGPTCWRA